LHELRAAGSVYRRAWRYVLGRSSPVPHTLLDMTRYVVALPDPRRRRAAPGGVAGPHHVRQRTAVEAAGLAGKDACDEEKLCAAVIRPGRLRQVDALLGTGSPTPALARACQVVRPDGADRVQLRTLAATGDLRDSIPTCAI